MILATTASLEGLRIGWPVGIDVDGETVVPGGSMLPAAAAGTAVVVE